MTILCFNRPLRAINSEYTGIVSMMKILTGILFDHFFVDICSAYQWQNLETIIENGTFPLDEQMFYFL